MIGQERMIFRQIPTPWGIKKINIGRQVESLGKLVARWAKMTTQACNI